MQVHVENAPVRSRHQQLGLDQVLDAKDDAVLGAHGNRGPGVLDRLGRIFNL